MRTLHFILLAVLSSLSFAQTPTYTFAADVVKSFEHCKTARARLTATKSDNAMLMMKDLLVYSESMKNAYGVIDRHRTSTDTMISQSARILYTLYFLLDQNTRQLISLIEANLNDTKQLTASGTWTRKYSENAAENESLWRDFPVAAAGVTHTLVDNALVHDGKLCCLRITKSEVFQLRHDLLSVFGDDIARGPHTGQLPLEAGAALIYGFLNQAWLPAGAR